MRIIAIMFLFIFLSVLPAFSDENNIELSSGQIVYVPIYSNLFFGPKEALFNLSAMISIRNTDLHNQLTILSVEYFDNNGKKLKEYAKKPIILSPLGSHHFIIQEKDESGGFGANFIVKWKSMKKINPPIVESIMFGARSGATFLSQGKVIDENTK